MKCLAHVNSDSEKKRAQLPLYQISWNIYITDSNRLFSNFTKAFQILFKTPNKTVPYPEDYILEMENPGLISMLSTKFPGIVPDDAIIFKCHISELCRNWNFALLLLRCVRPFFT